MLSLCAVNELMPPVPTAPFSRRTGVSWYQNVSVLDFTGAKDDGGGEWWQLELKACKALVKSSPPTNQHPALYRSDAVPIARPTVSKHWWLCLSCLWPFTFFCTFKNKNTTPYYWHMNTISRWNQKETRKSHVSDNKAKPEQGDPVVQTNPRSGSGLWSGLHPTVINTGDFAVATENCTENHPLVFITRRHAMNAERDILTAFLSVCPSISPMPVLCLNEWIYHQTFWPFGRGIILVFPHPTAVTNSTGNPVCSNDPDDLEGRDAKGETF